MKEESVEIEEKYADPSINIALDTIARGKQALFFVSTKPSAEKLAEEISHKIKGTDIEDLSEEISNVLPKPTYQCKRLGACVKRGIAFHHAGLTSKQRELIEDNFKNGTIKIICATPTLAIGVDLPAFRSVIRDLKRYGGHWGMQDIPVLEYQQMAGRAGRPSYDRWGEAITIAKGEGEKEDIFFKYITAENEDIYSKLAVEPVFRTYLLSLIASRFVKSRKDIVDFFAKTFWAYQYKDMAKLEQMIDKMLGMLQEWEFLISSSGESSSEADDRIGGFVSAIDLKDKDESYHATRLGQRVAELYLDPYTAHLLITAMNNSANKKVILFSVLQMICNTLEIRPLLRVKVKEYDDIQSNLAKYEENILFVEPSTYDLDYDEFLSSIKTAMFMQEWCDEMDEEYLLEKYGIRPGEVKGKLDIGDWLIYSCIEISRILSLNDMSRELMKARTRLRYGVKEELMPLIRLEGIGRARARKLFKNGLKTLGDIRNCDASALAQILGKAIAGSIKEQLGQEKEEVVSEFKRKGQMGLSKYDG